jgi:uroporphyrinogen-III synthase
MQTPRILITRPEPGASRTAERLREAGFEAVSLPLTRIERLAFDFPDRQFDGIVVTSAQALGEADYARLLDVPLIAVGETTARAGRAAGFKRVAAASGSAESVAALAVSALKQGDSILYLCGEVRRPELEALLIDAMFSVLAVATYNAVPVNYDESELTATLGDMRFHAVVLMSAVAAECFAALAGRPQFQDAELICFSKRIAQAVARLGKPVAITAEATEDSLIKLLKERSAELT